ncbi:tyrosine-type recombinase/integrase [Parageobacillus thermoglucosidasius]|uniref:tyrosine-type recombinase/integrase n=1 Tax=Parageobacillus thermoglucosidasius TaxID=1426 RepID=UPI000E1633A2|nr:site-specific integrase [Parageobacillus thermoglucosidasius]RDE19306.1 site-specific integrase [Parageobacillus thermoglucosidasius]
MASIQKTKSGWRYRVSYKENGKYKTKTKGGFRTKKEAELAAAELEKQLHKGYDINAGDQLFPEYMRNWFELYKKGKHSQEHDKNVELSVKLVEQYFQGVKLKELTRDMYQKFINEIAENRATETVKKRHTYIKECIKAAIEEGIITRDPTYKIVVKGKKKGKDEELKYLNYEEAKKLIAEIKKDMRPKYISRYIILFAIATGARFSEILGLTWDCVDLKNRMITINKTWDYKYTNDFADTKTYSSKRTIKIDVDTCKMLKELKKAQNETAIKTGLRNEKNLVFVNTKMELVSNNAVNKTLKMLCRKLGLKEVTMHSLRHTHASMLLYRKANIKYISKRLGHKDIGITLQTYSHILDELEQAENTLLDEVMDDLYHAK